MFFNQEKRIVSNLTNELLAVRNTQERKLRKSYAKKLRFDSARHTFVLENEYPFELAFKGFLAEIRDSNFKLKSVNHKLEQLFVQHFDRVIGKVVRLRDQSTNRTKLENYLAERFSIFYYKNRFVRILPDQHDRKEAFHDSLLKVLHQLESNRFKGDSSLDTYFSSIFRNTCINLSKNRKAKKYQVASPWQGLEEEWKILLGKENLKKLMNSLNEIKAEQEVGLIESLRKHHPKCYKMLYLHYGLGYSYEQIAIEWTPPSTAKSIKTQAYRCKKKLAPQLIELKNNVR